MLEEGKTFVIGDCPPISCDILTFAPTQNDAEVMEILCFFPGNPGYIQLYQNLLTRFHQHKPHIAILAIGNMGASKFSFLNAAHFKGNICAVQLAIKLRVILTELKKHQGKEIILHFASHSYGAAESMQVASLLASEDSFKVPAHNICIEVAQELKKSALKLSVKNCLAITPTIVPIKSSPNGRKLVWLSNFPLVFHLLVYISYLMVFISQLLSPEAVLRAYVWLMRRPLDEAFVSSVSELISHEVVRFTMEMGFEQLRDVEHPPKESLLVFTKVVVILAQRDGWIGAENESKLRDFLSSHSEHVITKLPEGDEHAFVSKEVSNRNVCQLLVKHF